MDNSDKGGKSFQDQLLDFLEAIKPDGAEQEASPESSEPKAPLPYRILPEPVESETKSRATVWAGFASFMLELCCKIVFAGLVPWLTAIWLAQTLPDAGYHGSVARLADWYRPTQLFGYWIFAALIIYGILHNIFEDSKHPDRVRGLTRIVVYLAGCYTMHLMFTPRWAAIAAGTVAACLMFAAYKGIEKLLNRLF
ncbi:hypothetical protein [Bombiscardovia apis]|uniref:hypothetical protein n=1 Tax=Bombiscardovia apis TaxID=2932182 RepID=UPI00295379DF|nr:hypothetical protein [Bombiscardovia apis]